MSKSMIAFFFEGRSRGELGEAKPFHVQVFAPERCEEGWKCEATINGDVSLSQVSPWPEEAYHMLCEALREWCRGRKLKLVDAAGNHCKFLPPLSFAPFRREGFARFADGGTRPLLMEVGPPFRIGLNAGSEFACGVYFGWEGEVGPLLGDTPDLVYLNAFRLLRRSLAEYGAAFTDESGVAIPVQALPPEAASC